MPFMSHVALMRPVLCVSFKRNGCKNFAHSSDSECESVDRALLLMLLLF